MKLENNISKCQDKKDNAIIDGVSGSIGYTYWSTPNLRYAKKKIMIDEQTCKYELRLQQLWQSSNGSQKWEWVEVVE
jgi:hypothetical protein